MEINLRTSSKLDFSKVEFGDFIVDTDGELYVVTLDNQRNELRLVNLTTNQIFTPIASSTPDLLKQFDELYGVSRIIKRNNIVLTEK